MFAPLIGWLSSAWAWLGSSVVAIFAFFGLQLSKSVALKLAAIAFFITATVALWTAIKTAILTLSVVTPDYILIASTWIIPDNFDLFITTYFSMRLTRFIYDVKQHFLQLRLPGM